MQTINKTLFNPSGNLSFCVRKDEDLNLFILMNGSDCNLNISLQEQTAECHLSVVYLSDASHKNTLKCRMEHLAPHTKSYQYVKGVATGKTTGVFEGVIHIEKDAQKCEGYQKHAGILLSDDATIKAIPELNIYADDVMCSHGSAVGPLDEEQVFYLMARGIDENKAKEMLLSGFLSENLTDDMQNDVKNWIIEHV
ncbi:MAG: SufD family Fe-S cluster assembly protein [Alphaproteobacteria bacterium]|nr:SufD family Fe-S cluster assembly protein [Alphaproteobacteria bacterium]